MQIFGRFYTTSDFDRKYLRNETRYPKSESKQAGELWSTIHKVVHVSLDPPKSTFSTDYISAPKVCWPVKFLVFLHALDTDQGC